MASQARPWTFRKPSVIPGFGLALGFTLAYLSADRPHPLPALVLKTPRAAAGPSSGSSPPTRAPSPRCSSPSAPRCSPPPINVVFGLIVAWVLVRYEFPGRRLLDAFVDLPFALPTAVAGIALTALYAPNGWIGSLLAPLGIKVAVLAARHPHRAGLHRPALRRPHRCSRCWRSSTARSRRPRRRSAPTRWHTIARVILPRCPAPLLTGFALALRPRRRRVRLGDLHRRQHPVRCPRSRRCSS